MSYGKPKLDRKPVKLDWALYRKQAGHLWMVGRLRGTVYEYRCAKCRKQMVQVLNPDYSQEQCSGIASTTPDT